MGRPRTAARRRGPAVAVVGWALLGVAAAGPPEATPAPDRSAPAAWRDLVGAPRPEAPAEAASVVVLRAAPAAARPGATGSRRAMRAALRDQAATLAALRRAGFHLVVRARAARTVNAVVAVVRPDETARLAARPEVAGVFPVRTIVPTGVVESALPVLGDALRPRTTTVSDGAGVTVAVLDGPVDAAHPYLRGRLVPGTPAGDNEAAAAHGTAMVGLLAGAGGPAGLHGSAPGARVLSVPVLRPTADGTLAGTTVDLLRGLERAADPDGDGDLRDRARVVLAAVEAPFAGFADSPEARAVAALDRLGAVVVAAVGNDGPTGARYGTVGSPAAAPAALAVGALDERDGLPELPLRLAGAAPEDLGVVALASPLAPQADVALPVRLVEGDAADAAAYRGPDGGSPVTGAVALLARDAEPLAAKVAAAAAAGASVVAVHGGGELPPGGLGLDDRSPVPVVALGDAVAARLVEALRAGDDVTVAFGQARRVVNDRAGTPAPFSSTGLTLDDGPKPDVLLPGIAVATAAPGGGYVTVGGSSAAAAQAAGLVAALAARHPGWSAARLRSALVSTAVPVPAAAGRPVPLEAQGGGAPAAEAAAATVLQTSPVALAAGPVRADGRTGAVPLAVTNHDAVPRTVALGFVADGDDAGTTVRPSADRPTFTLAPGETTTVRVTLDVGAPPTRPAALGGWLLLQLDDGRVQRVPVAAVIDGEEEERAPLVADVALSARTLRARVDPGARAVTLSARLGGVEVRADGALVLRPVRRLVVRLYRGGRRLGVVQAARDLLPGRYGWSVAARLPDGRPLAPGRYRLVLRAEDDAGPPSVASVAFRVR